MLQRQRSKNLYFFKLRIILIKISAMLALHLTLYCTSVLKGPHRVDHEIQFKYMDIGQQVIVLSKN